MSGEVALKKSVQMDDALELVDSILDNVILFAPFYEKIVAEYRADLYIKGKFDMRKKNFLIRFLPSMFKIEKNVHEYLLESVNEIHFTAPNLYDQKVKAVRGTISGKSQISSGMFEYFKMNIYSSSLLNNKLLSPLASNGRKYYHYRLDSVLGSHDSVQYKIQFIPKNKSYQLVKGYMVISDQLWTVREIEMEGRSEFFRFRVKQAMGQSGDEEFLPIKHEMNILFKMLGNVIAVDYTTFCKYSLIRLANKHNIQVAKKSYDLSDSFRLQCDDPNLVADTATFSKLRLLPLSKEEDQLYKEFALRRDTSLFKIKQKSKRQVFWGEVGDVMLKNSTVNLSQLGTVRFSPIVNPFLMSYSHSDGFSYRQDFKYNGLFPGDRLLRIVPRIGYNFKRNEFYWNVNTDFDYWPKKRAAIHLNFGNGNRIYSSDVMEDIRAVPDSVFNFDEIHLDLFRDLFFTMNHSVEVVNGLTVSVGLTSHRRTAIQKSRFIAILPPTPEYIDILSRFKNTYISFAPRFQISWTPCTYYYMNGDRKMNLRSNYPTFSLDYERGIKNVLKSTGEYERMEFDLQHHIRLGLMRNLYYRIGGGGFTNQKQLYFVDFVNFSKHNLPVGWNDDIGGVFQLLDGRWYNSSDYYARGHLTYDSPFLLLRHLNKYTGSVLNERLYFNILYMPHLTPYFELGYGIGTTIFDAGVFVGNENGRFKQIGFKFTFELFNK